MYLDLTSAVFTITFYSSTHTHLTTFIGCFLEDCYYSTSGKVNWRRILL